jgi:hypothetical protein
MDQEKKLIISNRAYADALFFGAIGVMLIGAGVICYVDKEFWSALAALVFGALVIKNVPFLLFGKIIIELKASNIEIGYSPSGSKAITIPVHVIRDIHLDQNRRGSPSWETNGWNKIVSRIAIQIKDEKPYFFGEHLRTNDQKLVVDTIRQWLKP